MSCLPVLLLPLLSSSSSSRSFAARFLLFLLCALKISALLLEGRGRPGAVDVDEGLVRRELRVEVNAKEEEVDISLGIALGLWCG